MFNNLNEISFPFSPRLPLRRLRHSLCRYAHVRLCLWTKGPLMAHSYIWEASPSEERRSRQFWLDNRWINPEARDPSTLLMEDKSGPSSLSNGPGRVPPPPAVPFPTNPMVTALLTDLYQFTMSYAYWKAGKHQERAVWVPFHPVLRVSDFPGNLSRLYLD